MTKQINDVIYIDNSEDVIPNSINEIRSSVSYNLAEDIENINVENLVLNAPLDYEIKTINNKECYVYGYPDKWNYDW